MHEHIHQFGFCNATTLAEMFLEAHSICDPLDPVFSLALDVAFSIAQEIRDHNRCSLVS